MTCTRCGGSLRVMETLHPEDTTSTHRKDVRKLAANADNYIVRRRKCTSCAQLFYSVELITSERVEPSPA